MLAKLNEKARSLQHNIGEFDKAAREAARAAAQAGDFNRKNAISRQRREAVRAANDLLDILEDQAMSTDTQKAIANELDSASAEARGLLADLKKAGDILDTVTKIANLATAVLGTVKTIVG